MAKKRGLGGLGGSPRTRHIPDLGTYRMGGGSALLEDWIAGLGQRYDINQAYQGYTPSPPSGGATRGLQLPVRQMPPDIAPIGYRQDQTVPSLPYRNDMPPPPPTLGQPRLPLGWVPPGMGLQPQPSRDLRYRLPLRRLKPKKPKPRESEA